MACFFLKRSFSMSFAMHNIKNVTIIGSGLMGSGIAQVTAQADYNVVLVDQSQSILEKAKNAIQTNVSRIAKKKFESDPTKQGQFTKKTMTNIIFSSNMEQASSTADLVIEAIVENIKLKQNLLTDVEAMTKSTALLATNTSSLKLTDISANLKRKENFGGLHFFNPVPVMKLLEVVRSASTSEQTFNSMMKYGESIGKVTVACKDTPGFIVNRLLVPFLLEAVRMLERGDATKEDIDKAMKLGAGHPMGPIQLADYVGLDTTKFILDGWHKEYPNEALFKPSNTLDKLVAEGKFGMKSGEGFYKHESK